MLEQEHGYLVFNNGFIIQVIDPNVDKTSRFYFPIAFKTVVWPVLAQHYHNNFSIALRYDLTSMQIGYSGYKCSYTTNSIVCGF